MISLKEPQERYSSAKRKALDRYLRPKTKRADCIATKLPSANELLSKCPKKYLSVFELQKIEMIVERIESGSLSRQQAIEDLLNYFRFSRQKHSEAKWKFIRGEKIDSISSFAREIGPMFFTGFLNQDIIHLLLEVEEGTLNEVLLFAIRKKFAFVRSVKQGSVKDFAWYLTYGLLPGHSRAKDQKADQRMQKQMFDLADETYQSFKNLIVDDSICVEINLQEEVTELIELFLKSSTASRHKARTSLKR